MNTSSRVAARRAVCDRGLEALGRVLGDDPAVVEDRDPAAEAFGLGQVVRRQDDRRVVRRVDLLDEGLDVELGARVEAGGRFVRSRSDGLVSSARAMATFCCMPRLICSIGRLRRFSLMPSRSRIAIASRLARSCHRARRGGPRRAGSPSG